MQAGYLAVLGMGAVGGGCSSVCEGPTCDDAFSEAELAVVDGSGAGAINLPSGATTRVEGGPDDGSDWVVVPDPGGLFVGQPDIGRVLRLTADATDASTPVATWLAPRGTGFGAAARRVGADLWVAAPASERQAGAVYRFPADALGDHDLDAATLTVFGEFPDDRLGTDVFVCADLTGDGLPEVIVSVPHFEAPGDETTPETALAGALFVIPSEQAVGTYTASELGPMWWGDTEGAGAGAAAVCDRDLNGDGRVDLAVGSPWAFSGRGQVHVLTAEPLPPTGALGDHAWAVLDGAPGDWLGRSLASFQTADGPALAIAAPGWGDGVGRVQLYMGDALENASPAPITTLEGRESDDAPEHFGRWLTSGDLDGDGAADVIVGAPDHADPDGPLYQAGRIGVWHGWTPPGSAITVRQPDLEILGERAFQQVGRALIAADPDGDGTDALFVPTRDRADTP